MTQYSTPCRPDEFILRHKLRFLPSVGYSVYGIRIAICSRSAIDNWKRFNVISMTKNNGLLNSYKTWFSVHDDLYIELNVRFIWY